MADQPVLANLDPLASCRVAPRPAISLGGGEGITGRAMRVREGSATPAEPAPTPS